MTILLGLFAIIVAGGDPAAAQAIALVCIASSIYGSRS